VFLPLRGKGSVHPERRLRPIAQASSRHRGPASSGRAARESTRVEHRCAMWDGIELVAVLSVKHKPHGSQLSLLRGFASHGAGAWSGAAAGWGPSNKQPRPASARVVALYQGVEPGYERCDSPAAEGAENGEPSSSTSLARRGSHFPQVGSLIPGLTCTESSINSARPLPLPIRQKKIRQMPSHGEQWMTPEPPLASGGNG